VETAFGDGQKRDGLASHGAKQSVGVAREPDRNGMHVSDLTSESCRQDQASFVQSQRKFGIGVKTDRHQEGICDSRPEDIIFRSYLGYGGAGIKVGYLSQKHEKKGI